MLLAKDKTCPILSDTKFPSAKKKKTLTLFSNAVQQLFPKPFLISVGINWKKSIQNINYRLITTTTRLKT